MIFKDYEALNSISPMLQPREVAVIERTSGCSGDCWAESVIYFSSVQEAQEECEAFLAQEVEAQEANSHVRFELTMTFRF